MADVTDNLDDGKGIAALLKPFYRQLMAEAFSDAEDHGISVSFDLANPFVQQTIASLAKRVTAVTETTKQEIREIVAEGIEKGWGVEGIQQAIRLRGTEASRTRAILIARTETASAYTQGSIAAYKASGVVTHTEWLAGGPDTCPLCEALAGTRAELGEEFADGVTGPPYHPACTCVLSPIVE